MYWRAAAARGKPIMIVAAILAAAYIWIASGRNTAVAYGALAAAVAVILLLLVNALRLRRRTVVR